MISINRCPECGNNVFEVTDHVDGDCDSVENTVISNLLNALNNDMGHLLMRLSDLAIAQDLHERAEDLQDLSVGQIQGHVTTWRRMVEERLVSGETLDVEEDEDEDDDTFVQLRRAMGLSEDAEIVGPMGAGSLRALLEKLSPGRSEEDSHFYVLSRAMKNVAALMNNDRADDIQVSSPHHWTVIPGTMSRMMVATYRDKDGDEHMLSIMQDENSRMKWKLWVLCPVSGMSSALTIVGTEQRAIHRASMLMDLGTGRISKEEFYEKASGKKWPTPPAAEKERADDAESGTTH